MRRREIEALAERHVPGSGPVTITRLGEGLVNETYRVVRDGISYALRLALAHTQELGVDRLWETQVLRRAHSAGLSAVVEYVDPQAGLLIYRWVEGKFWNMSRVMEPSSVHRIADLMRRIHALPLPLPTRFMTPSQWIDHYATACKRAGIAESAAGVLRAIADADLNELDRLPGVVPVLCHSDLHILNLIDVADGSLVLLDWEYAHASDPLWDLAGWAANNDFDAAARRQLLVVYGGKEPSVDEHRRLEVLGRLYDYVCVLWSELYLKLSASGAEAVATRAHRLAGRLQVRSSGRGE
jgi:thiamine kinase-like enzyme